MGAVAVRTLRRNLQREAIRHESDLNPSVAPKTIPPRWVPFRNSSLVGLIPLTHVQPVLTPVSERFRHMARMVNARMSDCLRVHVPHLQIVSDATWKAARERLNAIGARMKAASGGRGGRRRDIDSAYLLPDFARCAMCGGAMGAIKRDHGRRRVAFDGCLVYQKLGTTVCANHLVVRMDRIDEAVLTTIGGDVLKPKIIPAVIAGVRAAMKRKRRRDN